MSDVKKILSENGFTFKKQFGQNFITDTNLLRSIISLSGIDKNTDVVEIGCGAGTLTRELSLAAKSVTGYEIDEKLKPVLSQTLSDCANAKVVFKDFMKVPLEEVEGDFQSYAVVANLPYYITTPIVMRFIEDSEKIRSLTIMVQEEVAERFCAKEGTEDYGAITASIALRCDAKIIKRVPRTMFFPQPNVDSAVVRLDFIQDRIPVKSKENYRELVKAAFSSRRKTLVNNLMSHFSMSRDKVEELLTAVGVDVKARGETLSPEKFAALSDLM